LFAPIVKKIIAERIYRFKQIIAKRCLMLKFEALDKEMAGFIGHRAKDFFQKKGPGG